MVNEKLNNKVIKELELMSKRLKKRISYLEKLNDISDAEITTQLVQLMDAYCIIKREIVEISNMTFTGGRNDG